MPKKLVIVTTQTISASYGIVEPSDKPQEFDADFADHLLEIGNAEPYEGNTGPAPTKNKMDNADTENGEPVPGATPKKKAGRRRGNKDK